jgi:hypothetical protein
MIQPCIVVAAARPDQREAVVAIECLSVYASSILYSTGSGILATDIKVRAS